MEDILGCSYAVILLTQQEFDGPFCEPPELIPNHYRDQQDTPEWLTSGSAFSYFQANVRPKDTPESNFIYRKLGTILSNRWRSTAISSEPRAFDPNAGISPTESEDTQYQSIYYFLRTQKETANAKLINGITHTSPIISVVQWRPCSLYLMEYRLIILSLKSISAGIISVLAMHGWT